MFINTDKCDNISCEIQHADRHIALNTRCLTVLLNCYFQLHRNAISSHIKIDTVLTTVSLDEAEGNHKVSHIS